MFFCFSFYLIWNQFLRKDTRLSIGLNILRKKINELENLSINVEAQVDNNMSEISKKNNQLQALLQKTEIICLNLENNIKKAEALQELNLRNNNTINPDLTLKTDLPVEPQSVTKKAPSHYLKMVKNNTSAENKKKFEFGKSPFTDAKSNYFIEESP